MSGVGGVRKRWHTLTTDRVETAAWISSGVVVGEERVEQGSGRGLGCGEVGGGGWESVCLETLQT